MKNLFNRIFPEKNENYEKAKIGLEEVKKKFDGFVMSFPDISEHEIMLIKDKWETLPKQISKDVEVMAIRATKEYKSLVSHYKRNAYILPHKHSNSYEYGKIMEGQIQDRFTGKIYHKGDEYKFAPNQAHYLNTNGNECVVYSILTDNPQYVMKPLPKKLMETLNLT